MPFLRMCETREEQFPLAVGIELKSNSESSKEISEVNSTKERRVETENIDENLNAYQLGFEPIKLIFRGEFKLKYFKDKDFYAMSSFSVIIFLSLLMIVFSLFRKFLWVRNLAIVNLVLLMISTILFIIIGFIYEIDDVKYGMYVFLFYSILLIYKAQNEQNTLKNHDSKI